MENGGYLAVMMGIWLAIALVYMIPTIIAFLRYHHQIGPILVINLLLGWSFIGWVVALAMAVSSTPGRNRVRA